MPVLDESLFVQYDYSHHHSNAMAKYWVTAWSYRLAGLRCEAIETAEDWQIWW